MYRVSHRPRPRSGGEAPPPLCSCCPIGVEQASLARLGRVQSFLSQSAIPYCVEVSEPKKPPLLYANPTAGASDVKAAAKAAIDEAKDELERQVRTEFRLMR